MVGTLPIGSNHEHEQWKIGHDILLIELWLVKGQQPSGADHKEAWPTFNGLIWECEVVLKIDTGLPTCCGFGKFIRTPFYTLIPADVSTLVNLWTELNATPFYTCQISVDCMTPVTKTQICFISFKGFEKSNQKSNTSAQCKMIYRIRCIDDWWIIYTILYVSFMYKNNEAISFVIRWNTMTGNERSEFRMSWHVIIMDIQNK